MSKKKQQHFLRLYEPVHARFERFCRARACGDMPYEDLMNETLLIAYKRMNEIQKIDSFLSFLIGISIRILANLKRKHRTRNLHEDFAISDYPDPNFKEESPYDVEMLHQALAKLPELQREAIILFEITGFSIKEIMEIQQSSVSAVKQRLLRGRKALASIIKTELLTKNRAAS